MTFLNHSDKARMVYWALWGLCTALTSAIILVPEYLPMVDLPQHAAQVAIWLDWNDPDLGYPLVYRLAPLPPAFGTTALSFALAHVMSVELALKVILTVTTVAIPIVMRFFVKEVGGNPWWAFLGFPIGFGFPFGFGFINFCLGVPVALFLVLLAIRYSARPSGGLAASLFATTLILFGIHAIAFGFGILVAGAIILARSPNLRSAIVRLAPLLIVAPLVLFWLVTVRETEPTTQAPPYFLLGLYRLLILPRHLTGERTSAINIFLVVMMFAVPFGGGARFSTQRWRWIPLALTVALFLGAPQNILGISFIYQRFAVFIIPGLLLALDPPSSQDARRRTLWPSEVAPALALIMLLGVGTRFWRFSVETGDLNGILSQIPRGARLLYMPVASGSVTSQFPVYLHFGMWHQVRRGGVTDFSFARHSMNRFRYCEGTVPPLPLHFSIEPDIFDWDRHWGDTFDYFLVRSYEDNRTRLFKEAEDRVALVDRRDAWWLFRRVGAARSPELSLGHTSVPRTCAN
jgi:hypothetical protein